MKQAALIYNPVSGTSGTKPERLGGLLEDLRLRGIAAEPSPTRRPGHATDLARRALEKDVDFVLVWGGDGTLNEVATGMLDSPVPVGLLPGGSVNVFARSTGIPLHLSRAVRFLESARPRSIPVGMAGGRPFLLMAGIGLDAEVIRRMNPALKRKLGVLAFWLRGFSLLPTYAFEPFVLRAEGRRYVATSAIVGKLRYYGGRYVITPDARLEEPRLDVVLFQGRRVTDYLRYLVGVLGGFHLRFKDAIHVKTDHLEVETQSGAFYQLDGELVGRIPVEIGVRPEAIRILLPAVAVP